MVEYHVILCFFFFNDTATTEIYTLSLHDALPISPTIHAVRGVRSGVVQRSSRRCRNSPLLPSRKCARISTKPRSEEHTSELQSPCNLVCRLLLEKKKKTP